jgi:hypothetical protein
MRPERIAELRADARETIATAAKDAKGNVGPADLEEIERVYGPFKKDLTPEERETWRKHARAALEEFTISDDTIHGYRVGAGEAGDFGAVEVCNRALAGDEAARRQVAEWIDEARAACEEA